MKHAPPVLADYSINLLSGVWKKNFLMSCLTWLLAGFISFPLVWSLEENYNAGQPFLLSYLFVNSLYVSIMSPLHLLNLSVGKSKYFSRSTYGRFLHSLNSFVALLCTFSSSSIWPMYDWFHTELLYSTVLLTNPLYKHSGRPVLGSPGSLARWS